MADGKLIIETELGTKKFEKQLAELEKDAKRVADRKVEIETDISNIEETRTMLEKIKQEQLDIATTSEEKNEIEKQYSQFLDLSNIALEKANTELNEINAQIQANAKEQGIVKEELIKTNKELEQAKKLQSINAETDKIAKSIKKVGLALISVRSIYSLVSRASSAYLSQDTELAEKLRSVWVGLGSFLAPALEMISNGLLKALGYLNVFIKALTGIDFLARANAKALKSQANAQKELNRQTYDFDVVRTQQESSSGGASAGSGGLFQIPELDANVVKKLQEMAKWLKENWDWIKKVGEVLLITFGAVKIAQVLKGIAALLGGAGTGLIGLSTILNGLLTIGTITIGVYLLYTALTGRDLIKDLKQIADGLKEVKELTEEVTKNEEHQTEVLENFNQEMKEKIENGKIDRNNLYTYTNMLKNNTRATAEQIKNIESNLIVTKKMREEEKALSSQLSETLDAYEYLYNQGLLNEQETKDYIYALFQQISVMEKLGYNTDDLKTKFQQLTGVNWNIAIGVSDNASSKINNIKNRLVDLLGVTSVDLLSGAKQAIRQVYGFAQGGIVTQPTRALIGEAGYPEAVVPMTQDYLSTLASEIARFGGSNGGGTINVYLDGRLIQRQVSNVQNQKNFATNR